MKKQIFFLAIALSFLTSCTSITKLFPKQPRPFQAKEFNAEQWKNGDYQTRGEMAENLREVVSGYKNPWKKSADEVRQILGKPDEIVKADCCYIGRARALEKVEVWLYNIEIEEEFPRNNAQKKIIPRAFKLYFPNNPDNPFQTVIGEKTGDHSVRIPVVGYLRRITNEKL